MSKIETLKAKARAVCAAQTTKMLIDSFILLSARIEASRAAPDQNATICLVEARGLIMDELERRNPETFNEWLDGCEPDSALYTRYGVKP